MNKRLPAELVLQNEPTDEAADPQKANARAINAEPWEPLPGMVNAALTYQVSIDDNTWLNQQNGATF